GDPIRGELRTGVRHVPPGLYAPPGVLSEPSDAVPAQGIVAIPHDAAPSRRRRRGGQAVAWAHELPAIAHALDASRCVRAVGSSALLDGLRSGKYVLTHDASTFSCVVRNAKTGRAVGHLRFKPVGMGAPAVGIAFQVASAITLQYYLHEIHARLDEILHE